jgi:hypothetical protein
MLNRINFLKLSFCTRASLDVINKGKTSTREQEKKKERIEVQTKDDTRKCRTHNGKS